MGNGLLAQWRRGIVARGISAAALLAVPVMVAAVIGFSTGLSSLAGGLGALASGPDEPSESTSATSADLDAVLVGFSGPRSDGAPGAPDRGTGGGGGETGGGGGETGGGGGGTGGGGGPVDSVALPPVGNPPGGGVEIPGVPGVGDPGSDPSTDTDAINEILKGISDSVGGLLGDS